MSKLSIFSWFSYSLPIQERLNIIKQVGFDATSLWWGNEFEDKNSQPEIVRKIGLEIDYVHAPCNNSNELWVDGLNGNDYCNSIISCIDDCNKHKISTIVMHVTRLSSKPPVTQLGLNRIKKLVDYAEKKHVNLALENLDSIQHLDYIFKNIKSEYLGFCYDSGHEHYNHPNVDCLSRYGDKLFAVHLDDNCGDDDTHLLPYDGTINWDIIREKLKKCRDIPYLTLEVDFNTKHEKALQYKDLTPVQFLSTAYERLLQIR